LDFDEDNSDLVHSCRRIRDAYSPQLLNDFDWDHQDQSWANGKIPSLYFQACSGAKFDAIPGQLDDMDKQISDREAKYRKDTNPKLTDVVPEFATMTIGGNDAGFFGVVSNCIFHNDIGRDYGPDYPDPKGECAKVINETTHRVANDDEFAKGLAEQIEHVLGHSKFKDKSNFKLFVTGYARFFNQDDPACDKYGLRLTGGPSLTRILRNAINDLVLLVNHKVEETVHKANTPKAIFVDFDSGFEGHRFCEPNDSSGYLGNRKQRINSWFWSFSVFDNYSLPPGTAALCDPDLDVNCPDLQPDNPEYGYQISGGSSDPSQTPSATRTFHPKKSGHTAIKDIIKKAIKDNKVGDK